MLESECCASTDRQCDNRHHETDRGGQNEPINVDAEGNAKCLRSGYFKAGAANFKEREDGFAQTAVKVKE
jgi:hypothetical protein